MKKKITALCSVLLIAVSVNAQIINYDFSIQYKPNVKAYWQIYNDVFEKTNFAAPPDTMQKYLLQMFALSEPFNDQIFTLAWTYHLSKDYKNAVKYYYKAISKGYLPYSKYTQPDFILSNDSIPEYKALLLQMDSLKLHPNCAMDIPFCNLVIALFETDQMTRNAFYFVKDSKRKKDTSFSVRKYVAYYDSVNLKRLLTHIDQYGIPHQNLMTDEAKDAFMLLVHHLVQYIDGLENKRLFALVRAAIEDGRLKNKFLKAAIDYMHWRNNGQYFGTVSKRNEIGKYELNPPLIDPATVDKRRAEWLFEPLEVQMRNGYDSNYVLPKGYVVDLKK